VANAGVTDKLAGGRWGSWETPAGEGPIGGGATSHVWRARHVDTGRLGAVKAARATAEAGALLAREAALLARVRRRWGPALLDAGRGFLVTEWVEGAPVVPGGANAGAPALDRRGQDARERLGAMLAHALGRALEELHQGGVFHGDVKPGNVLWSPSWPARDVAMERAATLIDLGLAVETRAIDAAGGTARYASPELRARGEGAPTSDLWALGVLLAEVLDPRVARAADPVAEVASWGRSQESEPARWVEALLARAPGGRPSAAWIAGRAARWLGLATDPEEAGRDRVERVRRTYLALRSREVVPGATVASGVSGTARAWLEEAVAMAGRVAHEPRAGTAPGVLGSLGPVGRARWLVAMVGPSAASWPIGLGRGHGAGPEGDDGELALRATTLAQTRDPAAWTLADVVGSAVVPAAAWGGDDDPDAVARLVRELARAAPHPDALALAEDRVARSGSSPTLALQLASALARAGDVGRAWLALSRVEGPVVAALRAEILRRRGESEAARAVAEGALAGADPAAKWSAQATLARLAWDAGDLTAAERLLLGARGPAAAEVAALLAWRRGQPDIGLDIVGLGLAESPEGEAQGRLEGVRGLLELSRGDVSAALRAFGRAVELSTRAGAVVDEATYLTSEAAAAADAGDLGRALDTSTRAALLWERLGRPEHAARAWLARAAALATVGALHAADEAAEEARARALESGDARATAYARWAQVEVRAPGDERARAWAVEAAGVLPRGDVEDQLRAGARLLVWAKPPTQALRHGGSGGARGHARRWRRRSRRSRRRPRRPTMRPSSARCSPCSKSPRPSVRAARRSTPPLASRPAWATGTRRAASSSRASRAPGRCGRPRHPPCGPVSSPSRGRARRRSPRPTSRLPRPRWRSSKRSCARSRRGTGCGRCCSS